MRAKRDWLKKRWDRLRRALLREPRGHAGLCGAVLTEPVTAGAHAGLLFLDGSFLDGSGYPPLSGHGVIAALTIALERRLLHLAEPDGDIVLDTPAGLVRALASIRDDGTVERVSYVGVPAFVLRPGLPVALGARVVPVDVAFGGVFHAIVDGEAAGAAIRPGQLERLAALGAALATAVEAAIDVVHPADPGLRGISGTVFTGAPDRAEAHLRSATVFAGGRLARAPGGTGVRPPCWRCSTPWGCWRAPAASSTRGSPAPPSPPPSPVAPRWAGCRPSCRVSKAPRGLRASRSW